MSEKANNNTSNEPIENIEIKQTEELTDKPEHHEPQEDIKNTTSVDEKLNKDNELNQLQDKFLRLAAEMENLRRRTNKEVEDARNYSVSSFARDMLAVADNLQRTLSAVPTYNESTDQHLKSLVEGVEMTQREMFSTLERHGVKMIDAKGQKFDPHFHQAIFESPNPELDDNLVQEVVQQGFTIGDRILRPALVGVVKNPK